MNSKEALEQYKKIYIDKTFTGDCVPTKEWFLSIIKKDLDRLEKLEKALDKACERLALVYDCPVAQDLIDDLDCGNCYDNYKECWKKHLLREVISNE